MPLTSLRINRKRPKRTTHKSTTTNLPIQPVVVVPPISGSVVKRPRDQDQGTGTDNSKSNPPTSTTSLKSRRSSNPRKRLKGDVGASGGGGGAGRPRRVKSRFSTFERLPIEILELIFRKTETVYRCDYREEEKIRLAQLRVEAEQRQDEDVSSSRPEDVGADNDGGLAAQEDLHRHPDLVIPFSRLPRLSPIVGLKLSHPLLVCRFAQRLFATNAILNTHPCLQQQYPFLLFTIGHEVSKLLASACFSPHLMEELYRQIPHSTTTTVPIPRTSPNPFNAGVGPNILDLIKGTANQPGGALTYTPRDCPFCGTRERRDNTGADPPILVATPVIEPDITPEEGVLRRCTDCEKRRQILAPYLSFPSKTVLPLRRLLRRSFNHTTIKLLLFPLCKPPPIANGPASLENGDPNTMNNNGNNNNNNIPGNSTTPIIASNSSSSHSPFVASEAVWAICKAITDGDSALALLLLRFYKPDPIGRERMIDTAVQSGNKPLLNKLIEMSEFHELGSGE